VWILNLAFFAAAEVRSLFLRERVGVRDYGLSADLIPSPDLLRKSTSPHGRGVL